jgi:hypothetical protein
MRQHVLFSLALLALAPQYTWAQAVDAEVRKPTGLCFKGGPRSECSSFLITELGYAERVGGLSDVSDDRRYLFWEVGWMKNVGGRLALGGTLVEAFFVDKPLGLKPRVRVWLASDLSLDVGAGVLFENDEMDQGFTGHVGFNIADLLQPYAQVEVVNHKWRGTDRATSIGLKGGSYVAVVGTAAIFFTLAIVFAG